jgi:NADH:ubiquinone oxidoreductase subunit 6 (subunit J)
MPPPSLAALASQSAALLVAAVVVGTAGVGLMLPRPRGREVALGVTLSLLAFVLAGVYVGEKFAGPAGATVGERVYAALFWLFASVAVSFAGVMIAQRNPARGAMAFAVSVLATCGLFLLLAAPFLMAATVVVYAGATVVTFLFVLMLSHAGGPSDENDRSREPFLGSLAGLGFAGLVLFSLHLSLPGASAVASPLPAALADAEKHTLRQAADDLRGGDAAATQRGLAAVAAISDGPLQARLKVNAGVPSGELVRAADRLRADGKAAADGKPGAREAVADGAVLLAARAELPARNVAGLGYTLYSEHLISVELAGTLLLVATVGAVAVAGRRRTA